MYDDMAALEAIVSSSELDWTIVRPPGLVNEPGSGYRAAPGSIAGPLCAREDLADMLLDQLEAPTFSRQTAGVCTPGLRIGPIRMFREEVLKR